MESSVKQTVLVVEDKPELQILAAEIIHDELPKVQVVTASDNEEARLFLNEFQRVNRLPSLIWLDIHLPRESGLVLLHEIRKPGSPLRGVPVIVSTVLTNPRISSICQKYGVDMVGKPYDVNDVTNKIIAQLGQSKL